jgi:flavin reductase (DIM6/NTAB) family NADH-FMN oxidoreductase RutF
MAAVTATGAFAVNFLAAGGGAIARDFATARPDKFAGVAYAGGTSPVLLDNVVGWARCAVVGVVPGAPDHLVVLGEVRETRAYDAPPLMYFHRSFVDWPPISVG